jgi:hypothetical protein
VQRLEDAGLLGLVGGELPAAADTGDDNQFRFEEAAFDAVFGFTRGEPMDAQSSLMVMNRILHQDFRPQRS